jgi:DNA invertase Pin-like site-specific DNA recombinase
VRVAIYARVSTKDKGQSTDNQLPDLRRYAQVHQWDIYKEYAEEESGSTANRTQFQKLFADAPSVSSTWCYSGTSTASAERVPCH